jgi:hypothetical protein
MPRDLPLPLNSTALSQVECVISFGVFFGHRNVICDMTHCVLNIAKSLGEGGKPKNISRLIDE